MPSDFSTFALFVAGLASVNAYTEPTTGPSGNPIAQPTLDEIVPVGAPYSITWEPTCDGTVTILLLRGPSENIVPLFPIVEQTPNDGEYAWTPGSDLEPDESRYGLQLICDATGEFQYSTQFGISNDGSLPEEPEYPEEPDASEEPYSYESEDSHDDDVYMPKGYDDTDEYDYGYDMYEPKPMPYALSSHDIYSYEVVDTLTTYVPEPTDIVVNNVTYHCPEPTTLTITACPCTITHTPEGPFPIHPPYPITPTGVMPPKSDIVQPTGNVTVPVDLDDDDDETDVVAIDSPSEPVEPIDSPDVTATDEAPVQATAGASGLAVGGSAGLGLVVALAGLVALF